MFMHVHQHIPEIGKGTNKSKQSKAGIKGKKLSFNNGNEENKHKLWQNKWKLTPLLPQICGTYD